MIDPSIITDQYVAINFKFKMYPGHGNEMMTDSPLIVANQNLTLRCNNLWMTIDPPHIVVDQNLTENFKFEDLGWTRHDDWPPVSVTSNLTDKF